MRESYAGMLYCVYMHGDRCPCACRWESLVRDVDAEVSGSLTKEHFVPKTDHQTALSPLDIEAFKHFIKVLHCQPAVKNGIVTS